jgi:hypothetical protein
VDEDGRALCPFLLHPPPGLLFPTGDSACSVSTARAQPILLMHVPVVCCMEKARASGGNKYAAPKGRITNISHDGSVGERGAEQRLALPGDVSIVSGDTGGGEGRGWGERN